MKTLIAEDLLLLLLDDESGRVAASTKIRPLLGGALLIELAMMERIDMPEKPGLWGRGMSKVGWSTAKVTVLDGPAVDDPLLATTLTTIAERPRYAAELINLLGKGTKDVLLERLSHRELIRPVEDKVWGLFPRTTWPAIERTHETVVREQLQGVLVLGLGPDERTSVIISLLSGIDHAQHCVARGDLTVREIKRRAEDVARACTARAVDDPADAARRATIGALVACTRAATADVGDPNDVS